jgi:hypothetical protein
MSFHSHVNFLDIIPILTNFTLLLVSWEAFLQTEYFISVVFFVETFVSFLFHICKAFDTCMGMDFWTWHDFDHFFATSMVWLASVYLIQFPAEIQLRNYRIGRWMGCTNTLSCVWVKTILYLLGMFMVAIILAATDDGFWISAFAAFALVVIFAYLIGHAIYRHYKGIRFGNWLPPYRWEYLLPAATLLTYATILFNVQESWPGLYWAVHGDWHATAAVGWCFLLLAGPFCRIKLVTL